MEWIKGGITAPQGFWASGLRAGIKKWARDLGLLFSEVPAAAAGIFTTSRLQGAPLPVTREHLASGELRAVIVNSGNANCCTGSRGTRDARRMTALAAKSLGISGRRVAVCSTGVIGSYLPMERIARKIPALVADLSRKKHLEFAESILTTDKRIKENAARFSVGGKRSVIGAVCKGSGMIHPRMATMLCFITTDAAVERKLLQSALKEAGEETFNRITVDGDTSPNDTALLLANGLCGNRTIRSASARAFKTFHKVLFAVMKDLAEKIVADGEGVTQVAEVVVEGARSEQEALRACRTVANSSLVKTALFGRDPNWGRIAASVGASGVAFSQEKLSIALGNRWFLRRGNPLTGTRKSGKSLFKENPLTIRIDLGAGRASASMLTGDLTDEYIRINAHYRT